MSPETFVVLLIATLAVNLSPGPSILYVSSVAAANGFRAALFSVLGMSVDISFHVLAAATGLAALIAASASAFVIVKYLGAIYLVCLGVRLLLSTTRSSTSSLPGLPAPGEDEDNHEDEVLPALGLSTEAFSSSESAADAIVGVCFS